MKFSKFSELVNRILSNNHSHRRDMDVTIVVHSPGSIGSTPSVEVQSIHAGFDWDSGKVLIFPAQPLTTLTPEQITDITDSVRKGQSWHAYQEYKKHKEQLEKLSIELDTAKQRIAELEGNRAALAAENARLKAICEDRRTFIMNGVQLGFSPLSKTIVLAKMRDLGDGTKRRVGNDRGRDVTNEAAQLVWHLVMAEGGEINWELDDGSRMVLKAEKQEPPQ